MKKPAVLWTILILMLSASLCMAADKVSVPKGYEKWEKSKEKVVNDKKSLFYGIHYTYVDKKAMPTYQSGGIYPDGSRFVVVQYAIRDEGGKPAAGKKKMIVLMKKGKEFKATGGWMFAGFNPDGSPGGIDPVKNCYECHLEQAKATDLVISKYADFK